MRDLIYREDALAIIRARADKAVECSKERIAVLEAENSVRWDAPAVDAVPVVHGRWIPVELHKSFGVLHGVKCSVCGEEKVVKGYNYCPNCGAKMDGGE